MQDVRQSLCPPCGTTDIKLERRRRVCEGLHENKNTMTLFSDNMSAVGSIKYGD